jgi:hypothetical protein
MLEQLHRRDRRGQAGPGDRPRTDRRHQLQAGGGDDAKRAFGADQQVREIVAAIVLLERRKPLIEAAIGEHRLDPLDEAAHRAEAQHLGAAGVGRDESADRCRSPGAQGERETAAGGGGGIMQLGKDHACLAHRDIGGGVEGADAVHPPQGKDQGVARLVRRRPADHRRVAALRHQRHALRRAKRDQLGHIFPARRRQQGRGPAMKRPRQSVSHGAIAPASVVKPFGPRSEASLSSSALDGWFIARQIVGHAEGGN